MNILNSERFKQAEAEEGCFMLEPVFVREAIEGGVEFGTTQFFVYMYLRWCETFGKYRVLFAGKKHIAEHIGATEKEVDNALYWLKGKGLIQYIDFQVNVLRAKQKFWVSTVRLSQVHQNTSAQAKNHLVDKEHHLVDKERPPCRQGDGLSVLPQSEDNKYKKINKDICAFDADFDEFWAEYPRKADKKKARETYIKIRSDKKHPASKEEILNGVKQYKELLKRQHTEKRYVKMAQGWLNGRRWEDEGIEAPQTSNVYNDNLDDETLRGF